MTIEVQQTDSDFVNAVQLFVDAYNSLQEKLEELTFFDEIENTVGILFGSNETLRIENDLAQFVTDRHSNLGSIQTLEELGISLDSEGLLELDSTKLSEKFEEDSEALKQFFTSENGLNDKINTLIDSIAGEENSLLVNRVDSLQRRIDDNNSRILNMNEQLESERERLLNEFYRMEEIIGQLQNSLAVINELQPVPPLTSV